MRVKKIDIGIKSLKESLKDFAETEKNRVMACCDIIMLSLPIFKK